MAKSIECKCTYNFTCGYCLKNAKPWHWTASHPGDRLPLTFVNCAKCGARLNKTLAIESRGEGSEAGRTFYYCSSRCERTH